LGDTVERVNDGSSLLSNSLSLTLSFEDVSLLHSLSLVNLAGHLSFRIQDLGALDSLTFSLELHASSDLFGNGDIFNFVPQTLDSPVLSGVVQRLSDSHVEVLTLRERFIEGEQTDFSTHRSLSEEVDSSNRLADVVRRLVSVYNLEVQNSIDFDLNIVSGNSVLRVNIKHLLLKRVTVSHRLHERNFKVETGLHQARELSKSLNDHLILLADSAEEISKT